MIWKLDLSTEYLQAENLVMESLISRYVSCYIIEMPSLGHQTETPATEVLVRPVLTAPVLWPALYPILHISIVGYGILRGAKMNLTWAEIHLIN